MQVHQNNLSFGPEILPELEEHSTRKELHKHAFETNHRQLCGYATRSSHTPIEGSHKVFENTRKENIEIRERQEYARSVVDKGIFLTVMFRAQRGCRIRQEKPTLREEPQEPRRQSTPTRAHQRQKAGQASLLKLAYYCCRNFSSLDREKEGVL